MEHELDSVISSMKEDGTHIAEAPVKVEPPKEEPKEPVEAESNEEAETSESPPEEVVFPKKAVNAISRRDKIIAKERAEKAALAAELEQYRSQIQAKPPQNNQGNANGAPKEDDFDNYGDFLKAEILYNIKQEQAQQQEQLNKKQQDYQRQIWEEQRTQEIAQKAESHKAEIPDFAQVVEENADYLDDLPEQIQQAFLEADDASLAFYNLAKEGKLEALAAMSPYRAAMEIAMAQSKKPQLNRVTNAPNPIKSVQGRGSVTKDVSEMSGEELLKKYNIKF
jgi:hypothetical protein